MNKDIKSFPLTDPRNFINHFWNIYENSRESEIKTRIQSGENPNSVSQSFRSKNGKAYEAIFLFLLDKLNFKILSMDEEISGVELVKPDFIFKAPKKTVLLSLKTTARERWKQADWESMRFKHVYPDTKCYLITLNETEKKVLKKKIDNGLLVDGLDDVFFGLSKELNSFFKVIRHIK